MMRQLVLLMAVMLAWMAPVDGWARAVTVRSGEHADFSRLVVIGVGDGWTWQSGAEGGTLTAPAGNTFDLARVFDLIPRTRLRAATADGPVLTLTTAPGVTVTAGRQRNLFVLDLSGEPGAPVPPVALPAKGNLRDLGAITSLPGLGNPPQPASAEAQSIEQALLFRIAQAAGEGSLTVADRATLDALRRAGLVPPGGEPDGPPVGATGDPGAGDITCDQARAALTFPTDAPTTVRDYERAYLAMDRAENDPGLMDLGRGYLALALPGEALAILSLRADPDRTDARVLMAAAEALDARPPSPSSADLGALAACAPEVELWALIRSPTAPRAAPYALFQTLLAVPPAARAAMIPLLRRNLAGLKDSGAETLLGLMDGIAPNCPDGACPANPPAVKDAVRALSQLDRASLTDQAKAVYLRLLNTSEPVSVETAHHLDAMAYERRSEVGGALMRASALVAYARAGDFDTAMALLTALSDTDRRDPVLTQAATTAIRILTETASDADFLRLSFAHSDAITRCCADARPAIDARLATHGFGAGAHNPAPVPGDDAPPQPPMTPADAPAQPTAPAAAIPPTTAPKAARPDAATPADSALIARSREMTQSSAALRSGIAAQLATVGITSP